MFERTSKVLKLLISMCLFHLQILVPLQISSVKSNSTIQIKTHDSESQGQAEAAIIRKTKNMRPLSELFTRKSIQKLANALTKPPLVITDLAHSYYMESTNQQWSKLVPPILSTVTAIASLMVLVRVPTPNKQYIPLSLTSPSYVW